MTDQESIRFVLTCRYIHGDTCALLEFRSVEAEANVVSDPVVVGVAEDGFEERDGFIDGFSAIGGCEAIEDSVAKGVEPGGHGILAVWAGGERSGARDELNGFDGESCGLEHAFVDGR